MKKKNIIVSIILVLIGLGLAGYLMQNINQNDAEYSVDPSDFVEVHSLIANSTGTLTEAEIAGLLKMREEEKLARDVYLMLGERRKTQIFSNIALSEDTHTNAIKTLLELYGIEDPVKDMPIGGFKTPEFEMLYIQMLAKGNQSLTDALIVGATVEDLDIKDLNELMKSTTNENILSVYNNLHRGSRNHLRAYNRQIERNGAKYMPQYITQQEFTTIIESKQESGMGGRKNQK